MSVEDQTLDSVKKEIAAALQDRAQLPRATCQCCCNLLLLHRIQGLVLGQAHPRRIFALWTENRDQGSKVQAAITFSSFSTKHIR